MRLQHARIELELHELSARQGPRLLLLHALYGAAADWTPTGLVATWPGPVYALDFCGHGLSDRLLAGGYTPELLAGDADCALARIGTAALAGAGIGAYVALLLAGTRPALIPAALLLPGSGLAGGGPLPDFDDPRNRFIEFPPDHGDRAVPDPSLAALEHDVRPPEYVQPFARAARKLLLARAATLPPPWWQLVHGSANTELVGPDLPSAMARLAALSGAPAADH